MRDLYRHLLTFHFTVIGDSIAHGTGASRTENGLSERIYRAFARRTLEHSLTNVAVPGATIHDVLRWQVQRIPARTDVVLLVAGSNDVATTPAPEAFAQAYGHLLGAIRRRVPQARLFAAGIPNIALTPHVPPEAKEFVAAFCSTLSAEMAAQAQMHQSEFIDLFAITNLAGGHAEKYLASDAFHPSDRGYALLARGALAAFETALS